MSENFIKDEIFDQVEDSLIIIENYKILRLSSLNKNKKSKLLKYLRIMCLRAKKNCYEYNFRESEELLSCIKNHIDDIKQDENLYYQYEDTNNFFNFMKQ